MDIETSTCISVEHLQLLQSLSETYTMPIRTIVSSMISFAAESNQTQTPKNINFLIPPLKQLPKLLHYLKLYFLNSLI